MTKFLATLNHQRMLSCLRGESRRKQYRTGTPVPALKKNDRNIELSVVMPVHDEGILLDDAVRSVLNQQPSSRELPEFEIVLVADRADACTMGIAKKHAAHRPDRIRLVPNDGKPGAGASRNAGIRASRGKWVGFLDGDDVWTDNSLAGRWDALSTHPDAEWIGADFVDWDGADHAIPATGRLYHNDATRLLLHRAYESGIPQSLHRPAAAFLAQALCWTGAVFVKKDLLHRVGLFDESLFRAQDVHLWYRLAATADYVFVPRVVARYRQRATTLTRRGTTPRGYHNLALKKLLADPLLAPWYDDVVRKLASTLNEEAMYLRSNRKFFQSARMSLQSVRLRPLQRAPYRNIVATLLARA